MFGRAFFVGISVLILATAPVTFLVSGCTTGSQYKPPGARLPDNFPIECYPKSECTKADSTPKGQGKYTQIVILKSDDDKYKCADFYKTEIPMKGFRLLSDNDRGGVLALEAISDKAKLDIILTPVGEHTIISITYDPKLEMAH